MALGMNTYAVKKFTLVICKYFSTVLKKINVDFLYTSILWAILCRLIYPQIIYTDCNMCKSSVLLFLHP